ncbi:hypothetical protein [Larkinella rosea]|uniref:Plasmid maintenance system killer protein n=1 Tax=Larkinella rosea TaxID=2025312 RepID=A0A3P1BDG8_9BACT|nr:hypothetical protein [Larkinella rosea]RRA99216.1 hypothetical protein EHT25_30090 [Larkinella rosea]
MELAFGDRDIRQICEDEDTAIEKYGTFVAEALQNRLADLWAATSPKDLIVGEPTLLPDSTFKVNLNNVYRLIFSANDRKIKNDSQGDLDWLSVSRIKILRIERWI